jgi:peptide/nickel transport system permease protein
MARVVRSQTLSLREYSYIEASRAAGASNLKIIRSHVLPNLSNVIVPQAVLLIVNAILIESGLSLLGLGDPTRMSWGMMLYFAFFGGAFAGGWWWWFIPPGVCIAVAGLSFTFIGHGLGAVFNPRLRTR